MRGYNQGYNRGPPRRRGPVDYDDPAQHLYSQSKNHLNFQNLS